MDGTDGGRGAFGKTDAPPDTLGGGGVPVPETDAETPGGRGNLGSSEPQFVQTNTSGRHTVPHLGHLFSVLAAEAGRKHMIDSPSRNNPTTH